MMEAEEHVYGVDPGLRTHQVEFFLSRQITEMYRSELPERDVAADRLRVFFVAAGWLERGAGRVRFSSVRQRVLDHLAGGAHDRDIEAPDRDLVAGLRDGVRPFPVKPGIDVLQEIVDRLVRL